MLIIFLFFVCIVFLCDLIVKRCPMKNKIKKNIFCALATFSSMIGTPGAYAQINPLAFKGVTKCFKKGKESFSPTVGEAALESGLLYDLRFYGNFEAAYNQGDGVETRRYIGDKSDDPVWNVIKVLFPSSAGQLSCESTHSTSFGKAVDRPESISILLNFLHERQEDKPVNEDALVAAFLATLSPVAMGTQGDHQSLKKILSDLGAINMVDKENNPITKADLEEQVKKILAASNLTRLQQQVTKKINTCAAAKVAGTPQDKLNKAIDATRTFITETLGSDIEKKENKFKELFTKETLTPLLSSLQKSLKGEESSLYPKGTTQQALLAFFCYNFNTQEDIWTLLKHLDDALVDKELIPSTVDLLEEKDIEGISKKAIYDLDDILTLETADMWHQTTPYREGSPLLSNGNAQQYDRSQDCLLEKEGTFADCQEITIRHFMNLAFYDSFKKDWELSYVKAHIEKNDPNNPYFKNLESFYAAQNPSQANTGDTRMRSLFNRVVGDLNDGKGPKISYMREKNELNAGFINMMYVFDKLFSLNLAPLPPQTDGRISWLEESLSTLFTVLNPKRIARFGMSKLHYEKDEISGHLIINLEDKENQKKLFSFNVFSYVNRHAQIEDLENSNELFKFKGADGLKNHETSLESGTAQEALWLLSSDQGLKAEKVSAPLYALFHTSLTDNESRVQVLETLSKNYSQWSQDKVLGLESIPQILRHVLDNISWDDGAVRNKASPHLFALLNIVPLTQDHLKGVKALRVTTLEQAGHLSSFKNLHYLESDVETICVKGLISLVKLNLNRSNIKEIEGLEELTQLESLQLCETPNLERLSLRGLSALKDLKLDQSGIKEIELLEALTNLQSLNLYNCKKLEKFSVKGSSFLENLLFENANIKGIEGPEWLTKLKGLYLSENENLDSLSVKGLSSIKALHAQKTKIKGIEGLEDLTNLELLLLSHTKNLEKLSVSGLKSLKRMNLLGSSVKIIEGIEDLTNLTTLQLAETKNLEKLSLKGLTSLSFVDLGNSNVKKVECFEGLVKTNSLIFSNTKKLESLYLDSLFVLNHLDLINSSVQIITLKNLSSLEKLNLSNLVNLKTIHFEGDFSALKAITFAGSVMVEKIVGTACSFHKDIVFDFKESGIKARTQVQGIKMNDDMTSLGVL